MIRLLFIALLVIGCSAQKHSKQLDIASDIAKRASIVVKSPQDLNKLQQQTGAVVKVIDKKADLYLLSSNQFEGQEKEWAQKISKESEFAEPVLKRSLKRNPRDPYWYQMWGLSNIGQDIANGIEGIAGSDIKVQKAWELSKGSSDIIVAVIDTGIDYNHPDLKSNMWVNQKEKDGLAGIDDDGNGYVDDIYGWNFIADDQDDLYYGQVGTPDPMDDNGHGTHCAGTIGASSDNGEGVTGINWKVSLMGLKFLNSFGSGNTVDSYRAIMYAANNGAHVINASFGGGSPSKLIEYAIKMAGEKGVLFVAAAGNDSSNNDVVDSYPANYDVDNIISIAATDNRDILASFSNFGEKTVDLAAPGVGILSTIPTELAADKGYPYEAFSGTSMATPHVAGAAALVLSYRPELIGMPQKLKQLLMRSADKASSIAGKVVSAGRLNLYRALSMDLNQEEILDWKTDSLMVSSPVNPREQILFVQKIQRKDAKYIKLHIQSAIIDTGYDNALIFDQNFNKVFTMPATTYDEWTPAIAGDTAYVMFSNAKVRIGDGEAFGNFLSDGFVIDQIKAAY